MAKKAEVQERAAQLGVVFTEKMTIADLQSLIAEKLDTQPEEEENEDEVNEILAHAEENVDLVETVKTVKRRQVSSKERDESGKVVRKGRNLSGNQPFRQKPYFYDLDVQKTPDYDKAFQAAPMQVRLILKYMENNGITTEDDACIGADIAGGAINSGALQSKIDPAALFAYYRRVMERLGLRLAIEE